MSGRNYNEPYEDELDRMRARRRKSVLPRQGQRRDEDFDDFEIEDFGKEEFDEDEDFEYEDPDDDDYLDDEDDSGDYQRGNYPRYDYGRQRNAGYTHAGYADSRQRSGYADNRRRNAGYEDNHQRNSGYADNRQRNSGYADNRRRNNQHSSQQQVHSRYGNERPEKKRKEKRKRKAPLLLFIVFVLLLLSGGVLYAKRWAKDRDGYWNIAVFGVDSRDGGLEKGALADVQMIASINKKTGEIRLVSVYRDTYVQINDDGDFHKINEAYFKGGHTQALETLKRNLDVDVDDYATFNWKAVADGINILGGIDLEITESEFVYINSFITATVESTGIASFHLEHPGMNHLDGVQAVAYSRLRLMDTDFNRTERQRKVVALALEKAKQADFKTLTGLAGVILSEISTSIGPEDLIPLIKDAGHYYLGQTGGFPFAKTTADVGKLDCVIPMTLESNVIFLHQFLFDQEGYQPSESVRKISGIISERTGIYEEGKSAGADTNLGGATGNTGAPAASPQGGANQGEGENSGGNNAQAVQQTEAETPKEETTPEETDEDVTDSETKAEEQETKEESTKQEEEEGESKSDKEEEKTTAAREESEPTVVEPLTPEETTLSQEQINEGPGAVNPPNEPGANSNAPQANDPVNEVGPGFEEPGSN